MLEDASQPGQAVKGLYGSLNRFWCRPQKTGYVLAYRSLANKTRRETASGAATYEG